MTNSYNVGFIGFGFIGKVHAHGYVNLPFHYDLPADRFHLTHVCTSRQETAEAGRQLIGAEVATTDWREIAENDDIDIVHIASPNHLHLEPLLAAMASQKHIYCDKPLVNTMEEAEQVRAALPDYQGTSQMTFQSRFFPATIRARQLVEEGFLGDILEFHSVFYHSGSANPKAPLKWKLSGAAGGGVIADLGAHVLDLMQWLMGDFTELSAASHIAYDQRPSVDDPNQLVTVDAEDSATVMARLENGALGSLAFTKLATGTEDELRFEIFGNRGALRFNLMDPHHLEIYDVSAASSPVGGRRGWTRVDTGQRFPEPANGFPSPKTSIGWMRAHDHCLANFLNDVLAGRPGSPNLSQGIKVQELLHSCRVSAAEKRWVPVPTG